MSIMGPRARGMPNANLEEKKMKNSVKKEEL